MNSNIIRPFIAAMMLLFLLSCSGNDDDDNNDDRNIDVQELAAISSSDTWRISSYIEEGDEETHHFNNYTFTFDPNGTVTASNGQNTVAGTWAITDDSNDDDSPSSDEDFVLFFNVPENSDFDDLNDDWDIESYTGTRINLVDVSGGNGGTDRLVFEKN